jgi:hypothetical protein
LVLIDLRYLYLVNDLILLDENVFNNREPDAGLFQAHAGVEIMDRDNIPRRLGLRMRLECRGIDSKISLALSDSQVVEGVIWVGRGEGDGDNRDKESSPLIRRSTLNISLVSCEGKRANVGRAKQD